MPAWSPNMKKRIQSLNSPLAAAILVLAAVLGIAATTTPGGGGGRAGYVDVSAVIEKSQFAQDVKAKMTRELTAKVEPLVARRKELEDLQAKLDKQRDVLSEAEVDAMVKSKLNLMAEMEKDQYSITKYRQDADKELGAAFEQIIQAVQEVARKRGYSVVMRREGLMFADPAVDLTEQVVEVLDQKMKAAKP